MYGAHNRSRTGDLFITNEVLYRLSYASGVLLLILPALCNTDHAKTWSG